MAKPKYLASILHRALRRDAQDLAGIISNFYRQFNWATAPGKPSLPVSAGQTNEQSAMPMRENSIQTMATLRGLVRAMNEMVRAAKAADRQ
jgi:hypothetical protein